jgi:apolipoprotein N-acyltransferase
VVPGPRSSFASWVSIDLGLIALSAVLFALAFPSFLSDHGWGVLGFFCLVPLFIVVHRARWSAIPFYGIFFGFLSYAIFNYWLAKFHPLTLVVVPPIYAVYFLIVLPILKAADSLFPRHPYALQSMVWVCYEFFLKTRGFLAYSYGNIGYSQYAFLPFIRFSDLVGVWGVSLLVVFPSALFGNALKHGVQRFRETCMSFVAPAAAYLVVFVAALVYGLASQVSTMEARQWKVALVQQNVDPWKGGYDAYRESLDVLVRQSEAAMRENPEIVIWSETSFVPAIDWHTRYRTDTRIYELVKELRGFLARQPMPYLVGNDDGQLRRLESGEEARVDYNAAILFDGGAIVDTYRKLHLVPFTESFPFEKTLPGIYAWLKNADTHFWEKGSENTVFVSPDRQRAPVRFSTPICFEDTFGYLCRGFFQRGAEVLVNMTNDAWSRSVSCAMQHMSMAVFRAVENRRSVVRSTNAGITCIIDPNGRILSSLRPFTEGTLIGAVPVYTRDTTLYLRWGDWFPWVLLAASALFFAFGIARRYQAARAGRREPGDND